jgi:hypothetical protein
LLQHAGISLIEFENAHMRGQLGSDAVAIRKAFNAIDKNCNGCIDMLEVQALLGDEAADVFKQLINEVAPNSKEKIEFQTFFAVMTADRVKQSVLSPTSMRRISISSPRSLSNIHSPSTKRQLSILISPTNSSRLGPASPAALALTSPSSQPVALSPLNIVSTSHVELLPQNNL